MDQARRFNPQLYKYQHPKVLTIVVKSVCWVKILKCGQILSLLRSQKTVIKVKTILVLYKFYLLPRKLKLKNTLNGNEMREMLLLDHNSWCHSQWPGLVMTGLAAVSQWWSDVQKASLIPVSALRAKNSKERRSDTRKLPFIMMQCLPHSLDHTWLLST